MTTLSRMIRQLAEDGMTTSVKDGKIFIHHHDGIRTLDATTGFLGGSILGPQNGSRTTLEAVLTDLVQIAERQEDQEFMARADRMHTDHALLPTSADLRDQTQRFKAFLGTQTYLALVTDAEKAV